MRKILLLVRPAMKPLEVSIALADLIPGPCREPYPQHALRQAGYTPAVIGTILPLPGVGTPSGIGGA